MAVVDDAGNLLAYARMDRCLRPTFAIRKAYTSTVRSMDTVALAEQLSSSGRSLESFGDPQLIAIPGGVAVFHDGAVASAIGVGGLPSGLDDEVIAKAGVAALGILQRRGPPQTILPRILPLISDRNSGGQVTFITLYCKC